MISVVMFIATVVLDIAAVGFAGIYLWLNMFSSVSEIDARSRNAYKISIVSMGISLGMAFLTALMSSDSTPDAAIALTRVLFTIISISHMVMLLLVGAAMVWCIISRYSFSRSMGHTVLKISVVSIIGASVGLLLAWLL